MRFPAELGPRSRRVADEGDWLIQRWTVHDIDRAAGDTFGGRYDVENARTSTAADVVAPDGTRRGGVIQRREERLADVVDVQVVTHDGAIAVHFELRRSVGGDGQDARHDPPSPDHGRRPR